MHEPSTEGFGLLDLWDAVWGGKSFIIAITLVIAAAAIVYSLLATHIYRAEVVLAPASGGSTTSSLSGLGGLAALAGLNLNVGGETAFESSRLAGHVDFESYDRNRLIFCPNIGPPNIVTVSAARA